jgi:hypothetical protein
MKEAQQDTSENTENIFHCSEKINFYSENKENENKQFILIFLNISIISIIIINVNLEYFLCYRYAYFIDDQGIKETSCCVFAHHKPSAPDRERAQLCESC